MTEVSGMSYLKKEDFIKMSEEWEKPDTRTPEEIEKMKELGRKIKATSYEERRAYRLKQAEENGYY